MPEMPVLFKPPWSVYILAKMIWLHYGGQAGKPVLNSTLRNRNSGARPSLISKMLLIDPAFKVFNISIFYGKMSSAKKI